MPGSEIVPLVAPAPVQSVAVVAAGERKPVALVRQAVLCGSPGDVGPGWAGEEGREGGKDKEGDKGGRRRWRI